MPAPTPTCASSCTTPTTTAPRKSHWTTSSATTLTRGKMDQFRVPSKQLHSVERLGKIARIEFWRDDSGLGSDWYVDKVIVENRKTNDLFVFPVFRWIRPGWHYIIKHLDTSLPQFDEYADQRRMELEEKRKTYVFAQKAPGMPAQVRDSRCG
ncbi:hypothetical protein C0Q70_05804 [Pomacea canaliculata]|uniref:PLAT domain-containing protein n=1 Tax=Pomacea canaliculata TaxID=400727 RepID=A0A2T7PM82_POMCA|nr:hypothetical protein C0Q70_05804 [Pomacea canaliculata]